MIKLECVSIIKELHLSLALIIISVLDVLEEFYRQTRIERNGHCCLSTELEEISVVNGQIQMTELKFSSTVFLKWRTREREKTAINWIQ